MIKLLDTITGGWGSVVLWVAIAALVAGSYWYAYDLGGRHTEAVWSAKYATLQAGYANAALAEGTRQALANQEAKRRETEALSIIESQAAALTQKQKELSDASDKDADRDRVSLSNDSRMRIDSVR
jgi:hypothetical protein